MILDNSSINTRNGPSFGAGRPTGRRFGGGTGDSNACLTARRCTLGRFASALIDKPSRA